MEIGKEYALNNGDIITVTQAYWHYETKEKFSQVPRDKGRIGLFVYRIY